jgi:hypothetical protein
MHDLKVNFDKFHQIAKTILLDKLVDGNVRLYRHKPKMTDSEIIALAICQEALSIDSENYFWSKLKSDYRMDFPNLIHLTRYNLRRKYLNGYIQMVTERLATKLNEGENAFIVDSMPVPVCKISRESRLKICKENYETAPDKGYSAVNKQYYIGYKIHLVISIRGVFSAMDLSKASVHDIHYLSDIKHSKLNNCVLLGDRGYLSSSLQLNLFETARIDLQTPKRENQSNYKPYPLVFRKQRKRIETLFSQLSDHLMMKRNYAKTFQGLSTRTISKIAAVTVLQYINFQNKNPINNIKHALAA